MSSIKKSASFRSRIPVRRTKPLPRRCYSPPPSATSTINYHNNSANKSRSVPVSSQQHTKQNRRIWSNDTSMASQTASSAQPNVYSSSSYSSSDESQESEAPIQVNNIWFL